MMVPICASVTEQLLRSYKENARLDNSSLLPEAPTNNDKIKPTKRESRVAKGLLISICFA